jgi:hypothetical protein
MLLQEHKEMSLADRTGQTASFLSSDSYSYLPILHIYDLLSGLPLSIHTSITSIQFSHLLYTLVNASRQAGGPPFFEMYENRMNLTIV